MKTPEGCISILGHALAGAIRGDAFGLLQTVFRPFLWAFEPFGACTAELAPKLKYTPPEELFCPRFYDKAITNFKSKLPKNSQIPIVNSQKVVYNGLASCPPLLNS